MIELINISKKYNIKGDTKIILNDFNYTFESNKNIGLLGRNGTGKSTLIKLIAGSELPDQGSIKRTSKTSWPLGFSGGFSPKLTGTENLRFICRIYNADIKHVTEYVEEFSELGKFINEPINTYSTGMRARLAFGLSMAIDFDTYLVDETLGVGDQRFQQKCRAAFDERNQRSNMIIVSHSMPTLKKYCDKVLLLKDGTATEYEDIDEAIALYQQA